MKPKNKPNKLVRVGPHFLIIREVDEIKDPEGKNDIVYGLWREPILEIHLQKGINKQLCFTTLIHEIIHEIDSLYDARLTERQVTVLESGLAQVLIDNNLYKLSGVLEP